MAYYGMWELGRGAHVHSGCSDDEKVDRGTSGRQVERSFGMFGAEALRSSSSPMPWPTALAAVLL